MTLLLNCANALQSNIVITFSIIFSTTGMIQLNQAFNGEYLGSIFVLIGSILLVIGVICIFGIVEIKQKRS